MSKDSAANKKKRSASGRSPSQRWQMILAETTDLGPVYDEASVEFQHASLELYGNVRGTYAVLLAEVLNAIMPEGWVNEISHLVAAFGFQCNYVPKLVQSKDDRHAPDFPPLPRPSLEEKKFNPVMEWEFPVDNPHAYLVQVVQFGPGDQFWLVNLFNCARQVVLVYNPMRQKTRLYHHAQEARISGVSVSIFLRHDVVVANLKNLLDKKLSDPPAPNGTLWDWKPQTRHAVGKVAKVEGYKGVHFMQLPGCTCCDGRTTDIRQCPWYCDLGAYSTGPWRMHSLLSLPSPPRFDLDCYDPRFPLTKPREESAPKRRKIECV